MQERHYCIIGSPVVTIYNSAKLPTTYKSYNKLPHKVLIFRPILLVHPAENQCAVRKFMGGCFGSFAEL